MKVVINEHNEIVHYGEWDVNRIVIDNVEIETNPLPPNHTIVEKEIKYDGISNTWVEVGKPTDKQRIKQLENLIIILLEAN